MTTAIIGTGGLGSAIARRLAAGGEVLQLANADRQSAERLAATIGGSSVVADDNRGALRGADAVLLALRFPVLKDVIDEIAEALGDKSLIVPSNPVGLDAQGNVVRLLPEGKTSGETIAGWLPSGTRLAMAFGAMSADLLESSSGRSPERAVLFYVTDDAKSDEVERLIRTAGFEPMKLGGLRQSTRLEVGGDLHDLVVGSAEARSLIGRDQE
jgi:8-hydroxy-5-deazaflavin:NADPH oxidoreductase